MTVPSWLANPKGERPLRFWARVILKGSTLYLLVNVAFALLNPTPTLTRNLLPNHAVPGFERFPGGVTDLTVLFNTHVIAQPKAADEYRVILLGDSSTYGAQLPEQDNLAGVLNAARYTLPDNRVVRVYNLAYPHQSVFRDFMLLDYALRYEPDMIVWLVVPSGLTPGAMFNSPLVAENQPVMRDLITRYDLPIDPDDRRFVAPNAWGNTLLGQRTVLYSLLRLHIDSIVWGATGTDHFWPRDPGQVRNDLGDARAPALTEAFLDPPLYTDQGEQVIRRALTRVGDVPLLLINEPIFISSGRNSAYFYNEHYTRPYYQKFQQRMNAFVVEHHIPYLDLWDVIPSAEFLDTPLHYSPAGAELLAAQVGPAIVALAADEPPA